MSLPWAWDASRHVDPRLKMRLKFVAECMLSPDATRLVEDADARSPLGRLLAEWPDTAGFLLWPYQSTAWGPKARVERVIEHVNAVSEIPGLSLTPDDKLVLADLGSFSPDASLILDRAPWLTREGHLTLSLFKDDFRAFTVSFSLFGKTTIGVFIGGLQGRQTDGVLDLYGGSGAISSSTWKVRVSIMASSSTCSPAASSTDATPKAL